MEKRLFKSGKAVGKDKFLKLAFSLALVASFTVAMSDVSFASDGANQAANGKPAYPPIEPKETKPIIDIIWGKLTA